MKLDDGVTIDGETLQGKTIDAGSKIKLNIKSVGEGYLNAWIDLNADGDFNDTGEQIAKNIFSSSSVDIEAIIPSSHKDVVTYARFRYSSQQDLGARWCSPRWRGRRLPDYNLEEDLGPLYVEGLGLIILNQN